MGNPIDGDDQIQDCDHAYTIRTVTAGLGRTVCEECGNVSIRYEGTGAVWPEGRKAVARWAGHPSSNTTGAPGANPPSQAPQKNATCARCEVTAVYITPWGLACGDHAWEAASLQDPLSEDFWIPLLVDRSNIPN